MNGKTDNSGTDIRDGAGKGARSFSPAGAVADDTVVTASAASAVTPDFPDSVPRLPGAAGGAAFDQAPAPGTSESAVDSSGGKDVRHEASDVSGEPGIASDHPGEISRYSSETDRAGGESDGFRSDGAAEAGRTEGGFLRRLSRTGDKDRRLKILEECAEADSPLAGRLLWKSLADPCEDVRDRVVRVLAERDDFDLEAAAAVLANPPWYAKSAVLRVFALRRDPAVLPYVENVLEDANADVRRSAAEALAEIGGRTALRFLLRMRDDGNPAVRAAVEAGIDRLSPIKFS